MKITQEILAERLKWTLKQKIDHSLYIIDAFNAQYPNSKIAYSGGIDSTVMLKLIRIVDKTKTAIFANTTNEFSEILHFVKDTENVEIVNPKMSFIKTVEQFGFPLISKKVARMVHDCKYPTDNNQASRTLYMTGIKRDGNRGKYIIPERYKHLVDAPFDITHKCCDILKKNPMKDLSKEGIFIGTMATDSGTRRGSYIKTGCISITEKKCMPLSIWKKEDIWDFVKQNNLKYCDIYDKGETNTGCAYCGFGCQFDKTRFDRLKEREPKRHEQMMNLKNHGVTYADAIKIALNKNK
jgi:3'-phosphoadenosine 5'-phosphosulfate sulfotransferase (PAPS reductase)/FAD synthetase